MPSFIDSVIAQAARDRKTIVLPEGHDPRTLHAAEEILRRGIADLIILGEIPNKCDYPKIATQARIINPTEAKELEELAELLYNLRKHKGLSVEDARELALNPLFFGALLVKAGYAHGMVAGAVHSTSEVLRCALQVLKCAPNTPLVSSFFIMDIPESEHGENGVLLFGDCGLEIQPNAERLAHIALSSAKSWKSLMGTEPKVALLSHSSHGSAPASEDRVKVQDAVKIAQELCPELCLDGELQLDAALVKEVAASKAPQSKIQGDANILIFPDLDSGNIGYKLVQRLAKAKAYGPITQGIAAPVNDLSRGCSADDIVGVVAITALQAQAQSDQQAG